MSCGFCTNAAKLLFSHCKRSEGKRCVKGKPSGFSPSRRTKQTENPPAGGAKKKQPVERLAASFWRRWRDSNSRARFQTYSLSRGAPSPTWVHLQMGGAFRIFSCGGDVGGESGIRTHGSFESPVFKTGSLNRSDISPYRLNCKLFYHILSH